MPKPRIAIVSPFIDKRHGTERSVAECIERLSGEYEIHIYSNRVEDLDPSHYTLHRVPELPGPHLLKYCWWFFANQLWRWWDRRFRGLIPEVVFSPGINCMDADVIYVHVVFAQLRERMREQLLFGRSPWKSWHEIAHRRIYYSLIAFLEHRIYPNIEIPLIAVSNKSVRDLSKYHGRTTNIRVAYNGLDLQRFQPIRREALRADARRELSLNSNFVLLLIGNDWRSKGLPCVLEAMGYSADMKLMLLVVGNDNPAPYQDAIKKHGLTNRVRFLPARPDVEFYYAAADAYVSPTLEDAFALPPAEAMACGLPIITSLNNGGAEIVSSGENGFILDPASDFQGLAKILRYLVSDPEARRRIGEKALSTARTLTWDAAAEHIRAAWEQARRKDTISQQV